MFWRGMGTWTSTGAKELPCWSMAGGPRIDLWVVAVCAIVGVRGEGGGGGG